MEFQDVAVDNEMFAPDLLAGEGVFAPHAGVFHGCGHIPVDEPGNVRDGLAATDGKRACEIRRPARDLGKPRMISRLATRWSPIAPRSVRFLADAETAG